MYQCVIATMCQCSNAILNVPVHCHACTEGDDVRVHVYRSDYGCDNGRLVMERDNYYVDGNDECFPKMMMIITIVVVVAHPSVID